jgi:hypothetical protein
MLIFTEKNSVLILKPYFFKITFDVILPPSGESSLSDWDALRTSALPETFLLYLSQTNEK